MTRAQMYYKKALDHVMVGEFRAACSMLKAVRTSIKRAKCNFEDVGLQEHLFDNVKRVAERGVAKNYMEDIKRASTTTFVRRDHYFGEILRTAASIRRAGGFGNRPHQSGISRHEWNEVVARVNFSPIQQRLVNQLIS